MKMRRRRSNIILCSFFLFLLLAETGESLSLPQHTSQTNLYIGGLSTDAMKDIHSSIIDTIPWRGYTAGLEHRVIWGHTEEWYYHGEIPKDAAIQDIMRVKDCSYGEAIKIWKEYQGKPGRDMIAKAFRDYYPCLNKTESLALADQIYYSHILGDSTTPAGANIKPELIVKAKNILEHPTKDVLSGMNKVAMAESLNRGGDLYSFASQSVNMERLYVQSLVEKHENFGIYNPPIKKYIGIQVDNQDYVVASTYVRARDASTKGFRVILPDDEYLKYVEKYGNDSSVIPESQVIGLSSNKANMKESAKNTALQNAQSIENAEKTLRQEEADITRSFAKYAVPGAIMSIFENWGYICEAYKGYEDVRKVSLRVATDFVGYTVTPMIIQGLLIMAPKEGTVALLAGNLKQTGAAFYIGYFIYSSGKEVWAYQKGDIGKEELVRKTAEKFVSIPVMLIVGKVATFAGLSSGPFGLVMPLAFVAGPYIFSRGEQWYKDKKWEDVLYVGDIEALYGTDLLNHFTFLQPEQQATILNPEPRETFLNQQKNDTILEPEKNDTILEPEKKQVF